MKSGIGTLLALCREDADLPQRYIAAKANCDRTYISKVEADERDGTSLIDLYAKETGHKELSMLKEYDVEEVAAVVWDRICARKAEEYLIQRFVGITF